MWHVASYHFGGLCVVLRGVPSYCSLPRQWSLLWWCARLPLVYRRVLSGVHGG